MNPLPSKFLILVCSLPVLEDLRIACLGMATDGDNDIPIRRPLALPPLTGTLTLSLSGGMECTARRLLDMQICARFQRLHCTWWYDEDARWIEALMEACSDTLEYVNIKDSTFGKLYPLSFCYVVPVPKLNSPLF
jgi:hypothetical protein